MAINAKAYTQIFTPELPLTRKRPSIESRFYLLTILIKVPQSAIDYISLPSPPDFTSEFFTERVFFFSVSFMFPNL